MHSAPVHELRLDSRSNIFVMAALYAKGQSVTPVRVRNLSRMGALIESAELPLPGTQIRLCRASLTAVGTAIWVNGGKAGLQFEAPIAVGEWLPHGRRGIAQQLVDELFHQKRLRAGGPGPIDTTADPELGLSAELLELRLSLERAGEALALDTTVASRHPTTLQAIDCVSQALARLAANAALHDTTLPMSAAS